MQPPSPKALRMGRYRQLVDDWPNVALIGVRRASAVVLPPTRGEVGSKPSSPAVVRAAGRVCACVRVCVAAVGETIGR